MPGATFSRLKTWGPEILTNEDLNNEIDNILENLNPDGMASYAENVAQYKLQTDPGELGSESLPDSLAEEVERLRYVIARLIFGTPDQANELWYVEADSNINDLFAAVTEQAFEDPNRIESGRVRNGSSQLIALTPVGNLPQVKLQGLNTPFVYYINGTQYTINTDVTLTLTTAPGTNNTMKAHDTVAGVTDFENDPLFDQLKYVGEFGTSFPLQDIGSEITSLAGKQIAFMLDDEISIGRFLQNSYSGSGSLVECRRGFFFDALDNPLEREAYDPEDVMTLLKIAYIFAKADGTLAVTYNEPKTGEEPSGASSGDYWFDNSVRIWKRYNGSAWVDATATFIGWAACDATNCIAARTYEPQVEFAKENTIKLERVSNTVIQAKDPGSIVTVFGSKLKNPPGRFTWNMATDLDTGVSETALTTYFLYLTENGHSVISDIGPYDRTMDLGGYYHPFHTWRCVGQVWNDSSSNIVAVLDYVEGNQSYCLLTEFMSGVTHRRITLFATPMYLFKSNNPANRDFDAGADELGKSSEFRIPFQLYLQIYQSSTFGKTADLADNLFKDNEFLFIHLLNNNGFPDLGISGMPNAYKNEEIQTNSAAATGSDTYANSTYLTAAGRIASATPVAMVKLPTTSGASTWTEAWLVIITPGFFLPVQYDYETACKTITADSFAFATAGYASNDWAQLSNNEFYVATGKYLIFPMIRVSGSGTYTFLHFKLGSLNGDNTASEPPGLFGSPYNNNAYPIPASAGGDAIYAYPPIMANIDPDPVYLCAKATYASASTLAMVVSAIIQRVG